MNLSPVSALRRACCLATCLVASATLTFGAPPVLRWNPTSTNLWDATSLTWLDAGANAVAWQPGSEARFESWWCTRVTDCLIFLFPKVKTSDD